MEKFSTKSGIRHHLTLIDFTLSHYHMETVRNKALIVVVVTISIIAPLNIIIRLFCYGFVCFLFVCQKISREKTGEKISEKKKRIDLDATESTIR